MFLEFDKTQIETRLYSFRTDTRFKQYDVLVNVRVNLDPKMNGCEGTNLSCTEGFVLMWKCHKATSDFRAVRGGSKEA